MTDINRPFAKKMIIIVPDDFTDEKIAWGEELYPWINFIRASELDND